jgi:NAD(P)-dependent dehydrogenase (short-subunit alcohol dehydrogenase family)
VILVRWKESVVIVTGAGRGIGQALALAYGEQGAKVVVAELDSNACEQVAETIEKGGGQAIAVPVDVSQPAEVERLINRSVETYGTVNIMINNAGIMRSISPYDLALEDWEAVIGTNLTGTFLCSREAAKVMREFNQGGSIVNISSTRSLMSEPNTEAYAASKAGIVGLTHALAVSLGAHGIRVNCISPGWIETGDYTALRDADHKQHPAGRVGKPSDIVKACFYLTDPDNDFVTGINLVVDGGMTRKMIYEE